MRDFEEIHSEPKKAVIYCRVSSKKAAVWIVRSIVAANTPNYGAMKLRQFSLMTLAEAVTL